MRIREHALIRSYLTAVEQEAAALPDGRREELLADLTEHISVSLAEAGDESDETVRQVLGELGTPRAIVESAVAEDPGPAVDRLHAGSDLRTGLVLILLPLSGSVGPLLHTVGLVAAVVGVSLLWSSKQWGLRDRVLGTLIPVSALVVGYALEMFFGYMSFDFGYPPFAVTAVLAAVVPVLGSVHLFRAARRRNAARTAPSV
ncbi:hypothetical protein H181DRAFT_03465 [Streptomyces sp. WMMB 714]|uniref:HAAS signaling domain-containing protein n=1 Tax=Streptomyces sp. WMMB 714 TaxID=1286822 RepID=UPI000696BB2C|nr:hypothetical protein [Streptomyces sp. WMMB 714]SCK40026.1 hypothetical protein H181DRAFT_03465 [Streptomyces sp. WMMB 714]